MGIHAGDVLFRRADRRRYRVLAMLSNRGPDRPPTDLCVIELNTEKFSIVHWSLSTTRTELAEGEVVRVVEPPRTVGLGKISESEHELLEKRWQLVLKIKALGTKVYDRTARGTLARELEASKESSKPFFYDTLRRYLQTYAGKQGLAPNFYRCGAPGTERIPADGATKVGKKRRTHTGLLITEIHRQRMYVAFTKSPVGLKGKNLRQAYYWMLVKYYFTWIRIKPQELPEAIATDPADAELQFEAKPPKCKIVVPDAVPTFPVFRYHYNKLVSRSERARRRLGPRRFSLLYTAQLTGTLTDVNGVGARYYIDSTMLDVYCVSRFNKRRIIGRPTLYLVVDQFSRLVVGMYLGLEPPCWVGALLALYNCFVDKVAFCSTYDIAIEHGDWPTGGMPQHLMGDRGEHSSQANDRLVDGFGLDIENARPYSGEAKAVGERGFGVLQSNYGTFTAGYVDKDFANRDAEPAELCSALDYVEIMRVMLRGILDMNLRTVHGYEASPEQVAAGVPSQPLALWHWCMSELRYSHRPVDLPYLKRYLWPRTPLKTSRKMLRFCKGLYFQGERLDQQDWFFEALRTKAKFEACYHPTQLGEMVVLAPERGATFLVSPSKRSEKYAVYSHSEVMSLQRQSSINDANADAESLVARATHQASALHEVHSALKERKRQEKEGPPLSKSARRAGIRDNRADEIAAMTAEALGLNSTAPREPSPPREQDGTVDAVRAALAARKAASDAA